jgi:hypothetical protein
MSGSLYLAQIMIVAAALAAAVSAAPEGLGQLIRRWQLLLPAGLAALVCVAEIVHPSLEKLDQPEVWLVAVAAGVVGFARGHFMRLEVDQVWNVIRLRAREGLWLAVVLALLAIAEAVEVALAATLATADATDLAFRPLVEFGMALVAGFMVGRAGAAWLRVPDVPHSELIDPQN